MSNRGSALRHRLPITSVAAPTTRHEQETSRNQSDGGLRMNDNNNRSRRSINERAHTYTNRSKEDNKKRIANSINTSVGSTLCCFYLVSSLLGGLLMSIVFYGFQPLVHILPDRKVRIRGYFPLTVSPRRDLPVVVKTWAICTEANQPTRDLLHHIRNTSNRLSTPRQRQRILYKVWDEQHDEPLFYQSRSGRHPCTTTTTTTNNPQEEEEDEAVGGMNFPDIYEWWKLQQQQQREPQRHQPPQHRFHLLLTTLCAMAKKTPTQSSTSSSSSSSSVDGWLMDTEIQWEQNWPANQNVAFEIHDNNNYNNNNNNMDDEDTENGRMHAGIVLLGCYTRSTVAHELYQWMLQQPLSTQDNDIDDDDAVAALEKELYRLVVREDRNGHCWTIGQVRCAMNGDDEPIVDPPAMERVGQKCSPEEGCCHYYLPSKYSRRKQPQEEPEEEEALEPPNLRKR